MLASVELLSLSAARASEVEHIATGRVEIIRERRRVAAMAAAAHIERKYVRPSGFPGRQASHKSNS